MDTGLLNPEVLQILGASSAALLIGLIYTLWRAERSLRMVMDDAAIARNAFLATIKEESENSRAFLTNHMSPMTAAMNEVCGSMKGLAAIISDCAARRGGGNAP